jgi:methionyl-tRNA formyltransferase
MRIAFIGCVEFSYTTLAHTMNLPDVEIVGVVTRRSSSFNSDFRNLEDLAERAGAPVLFSEGNDQASMATFLKETKPDVIYCFGWSNLLGRDILDSAPRGVVGYHPAELPANRGRHPLIWALVLGLRKTASSFFVMDAGADSGDIIDQEPMDIGDTDNAATLYAKMSVIACMQITRMTVQLAAGKERRVIQNNKFANTWRKRNISDGEIDWRMSAKSVHNLVRALTRPYAGAHCIYQGCEVKVWAIEPKDNVANNLEPGKVLSVDGDIIEIKCAEGSVRVLEHEFSSLPQEGAYL